MLTSLACHKPASSQTTDEQTTVVRTPQQEANAAIYNRVAAAVLGQHDASYRFEDVPTSDLVIQVALQFLETPYVGGTLEEEPEQLRVFMDKTDCILFVEMSTAMALTLKGKRIVQNGAMQAAEPCYELLEDNIRNMRYRDGIVDGYASRIHYTSEWLIQNRRNGVLREFTHELGREFTQHFSFMTQHVENYKQLADSAALEGVRQAEQRLEAAAPYYFISQEQLRQPEVISQIRNGDIITFISKLEGLDLAHVALAYEHEGQMHFIHASYGAKKVIIEPKTLADYATNGLRISRLN